MGARIHFEGGHTVVPSDNITGTGTVNRLAKFTAPNIIGDSLIFDNGTNVGIGTTSPSAKLDVSSTAPVFRLTDNQNKVWTTGETMSEFQTFTSDGSGIGQRVVTNIKTVTGVSGTTMGGELAFEVSNFNSNTSEAMRIKENGNVGIGTSSPGAKLDVRTNVGSVFLNLQGTNETTSGESATIRLWGTQFNTTNRHSEIANVTSGSTANNNLVFKTNGSEQLRITSSGNVGIGTTSPSTKFHLVGGIARFDNASSNYLEIDGSNSISNNAIISNRFNQLQFVTNAGAGAPHIALLPGTGGNVGIGTTNPTSRLQVTGLEVFANNTDALAGGLTPGAFYTTGGGSLRAVI